MLNTIYGKAILYGYFHVEKVCEQIRELVKKKALSSIADCSPALCQCEEIVTLNWQIGALQNLQSSVMETLKSFSAYELKLLDYKYFKQKNKEEFEGFDYTSRSYFRNQQSVCLKFCKLIEKKGIDDSWFNGSLLKIKFIQSLVKRVEEMETTANKNKVKFSTNKINKVQYKRLTEGMA